MGSYRQVDRWHMILFGAVALIIVVADQLSKLAIIINLAVGQSIPETGFIRITHVQNTGAAFSIFYGHNLPLTIVAFLGIIIVLCYAFFINRRFPLLNNRFGSVVLGMILGGIAGNLIDRLRLGHVTDFIGIGPWPLFNVSDSCLTVGIIIFAFMLLSSLKAEKSADS